MCRVIAIAIEKGGVGKTTTTCNIGAGLVRKGKKVLLVDLDPQGSLTASLGFDKDSLECPVSRGLESVFSDDMEENDFDISESILSHEEGMDLIGANSALTITEINLQKAFNREYVLRTYFQSVYSEYDYILIDCPPSLGLLTINALACADGIIIPMQAAKLSVDSLEQTIKMIGKIRKSLNSGIQIMGILITMTSRTNYNKGIYEAIKEAYGESIPLLTPIPRSVRVEEQAELGKSIFNYDPRGKAAIAYESVVKEVLGNEE